MGRFILILLIETISKIYSSIKKKSANQNKSKIKLKARTVENDSNAVLHKINLKDYERYILLKNTNQSHIFKMITEYGDLSGNYDYIVYNFEIAKYYKWHIIKVPEKIDFYVYHNLVGWLNGYEKNENNSEFTLGLSKHKINPKEDYIFYLNPNNNFGDTLIGSFRNGKSLSIYLPAAYEEYGNLQIINQKLDSFEEVEKIVLENEFDIKNIKTLKFNVLKIKMSE